MTYDRLPPGTQRIEDKAGEKILLAPQPNADPNQPLVFLPSPSWLGRSSFTHIAIELVGIPEVSADDHSMLLCIDGFCNVSPDACSYSFAVSETDLCFSSLCVAVPLWQDFNEELGMVSTPQNLCRSSLLLCPSLS